jgi:spermidine/putrescine transport system substrate-binding protein
VADQELQAYLDRISKNRVNRRSFLKAAGLMGGSAALAACNPGSGAATDAPASAAPASAAPAPAGSAAPSIAAVEHTNVEKDLFIYNWSDYISPANMDAFEARYGTNDIVYDTYADNEELIAKLQAGASGYDIAAPTAEYLPGMVEQGFLQKLDLSRIPTLAYMNPTFQSLWWDPTNEYHVPKDYGTTGILYRKSMLSKVPQSWQEFYDMVKGEASGKTVFVTSQGDVFTFPLKLRGYSLNSVDKDELEEARQILLDVAPHILALDSDTYGDRMASGEAALTLGWTGPLGQELADLVAEGDAGYVVPSEGTLFWLDTWVMLTDAPHPNAAYAWLDFIHEPEVQGEETNFNLYATPNDAAKAFVKPEILSDPAIFPPEDVIASLEGAEDTSGNTQRSDIMEEFRQAVGG